MDVRQPLPRPNWKKKEKKNKKYFRIFFQEIHCIIRSINPFISISNKILGSKANYKRVIFQESGKIGTKGSVLALLSPYYIPNRDQLETSYNNNHRMHNNVRIIYWSRHRCFWRSWRDLCYQNVRTAVFYFLDALINLPHGSFLMLTEVTQDCPKHRNNQPSQEWTQIP